MTFGLINWLKSRFPDLSYEVPLFFPSREQPDGREWLITNNLGGYAMSTVSGAHTRRYHGLLFAALKPPHERHLALSKIDEHVVIDGQEYDLSTNHWTSGVVSPTGYRHIESFTTLPSPTWVFDLDGNYLIKQLCLAHESNAIYASYYFLPDAGKAVKEAKISLRFLVAFRDYHSQVSGSSDDRYPQFVSPKQTMIILNESASRLCLTWSDGVYEPQRQWWWNFQWPKEATRGQPDSEDLFLVGTVSHTLEPGKEFSIGASFEQAISDPSCHQAVEQRLARQMKLINRASLPRSEKTDLLILACDQFLVKNAPGNDDYMMVIAGYPWFNHNGREAMISLPGLTISTRRFDDAKKILTTYSAFMKDGLLPNRFPEKVAGSRGPEYTAADVTLWWIWALYHYYQVTKDKEFVWHQYPLLVESYKHLRDGTHQGIAMDKDDGLLRCASESIEFSWMDTRIADIPITHRAGKAVEICALWYNFLKTALFLGEVVEFKEPLTKEIDELSKLCHGSMQKFWNKRKNCLFDVVERGLQGTGRPDESIRPNQLLAVGLPFRAFATEQEKGIMMAVEAELLTPMGLRSLGPQDPAYQGVYGCGFAHADQYHRDLSYHQGTAWPWLLGMYADALVNVFGPLPEANSRIAILFQALMSHALEEACLGTISEIFDGNRPQTARGCPAYAPSVAEVMRWQTWQLRH